MKAPGQFTEESLVAFADPIDGELREVLAPLTTLDASPPSALFGALHDDACLADLAAALDDKRPPAPGTLAHERRLWGTRPARTAIDAVFDNYRKRLPLAWSRWLEWTHWIYAVTIPDTVPSLLEVFEALIAVEAQLQVDAVYPNRDHVVHQLADAQLAVALYDHAHRANPMFDDSDWNALVASVPGTVALSAEDRRRATRCGLALAGMFHDVGYLRYIGAQARLSLAASFGLVAPGPGFDPWQVALAFSGSYIDHVLTGSHLPPTSVKPGPTLVVDVFGYAWEHQWHGPLAAYFLCAIERALRAEGRVVPLASAALQIGAAAAFFHELHDVDEPKATRPSYVNAAEECTAAHCWPAMFRFVDEAQCWIRPELVPSPSEPKAAILDLGAERAKLDHRTFTIWPASRGVKEVAKLQRLIARSPQIFTALAIDEVRRG